MTPARGPALAGLPVAMVRVWWAPRRVVRGLSPMAEPSLLVMLMLAMGLFLIAQVPVHLAAARADPSIPAEARLGGAALSVMFLMPLAAYAVAALSAGLSGLAGRWTGRRRLPGPEARLALFWALLAIAPVMVLSGAVRGTVGPGPAAAVLQALAGLGFLYIWGAGIAALTRTE